MASKSGVLDVESYARHIHFYVDDTTGLLLDTLASADWQTYLDLGCGDGITLYTLDRKGLLAGKTVYAVDLSEKRVALARQINPAFQVVVDDACHLQHIPPGSVDMLVSIMVIEHVPDDGQMVEQVVRALRPGGTAYLSTVFKKWYGWYFYRCNGKWTIDPTHLREYTADEQLLGLLRRAGLEVVTTAKTLQRFPLTDFIFRRLPVRRDIYENRLFRALRRLRLPIPGYYNWEIVCRKPGE